MKGKQTTVHEVSRAHLVPHALKILMKVDSVSSGIAMQIHPMIQCDLDVRRSTTVLTMCETNMMLNTGPGY